MPERVVHLSDVSPRRKVFSVWERQRNRQEVHWLMECFAETLGVFFYTYAGVGSTVGFIVGSITGVPGLSSILQCGLGYMGGILLAIVVCGPTSGAHFSPSVTIAYTVFKKFPVTKAVRYIVAQILGAYIACALVYVQYKIIIDDAILFLEAHGTYATTMFTPKGPAGIFGLYLFPGQTLGRVFLNEFMTNIFVGMTIWAAIDPSNPLIPPSAGPLVVSLAYAAAIWGFSVSGIALNSARDIGGRLLAITVWGVEAGGGKYAAIAALTNIPAVLFAAFLYEIFLTDSDRVVPNASLEFISTHTHHKRIHATLVTKPQIGKYVTTPSKLEMQSDPDKALAYELSERESS